MKSDNTVLVCGRERKESRTNIYLDEEDLITWSDLKKLPALYEIDYTGSDVQLLDACASVKFFSKLTWKNHSRNKLDFTGLNFKELILDVTTLEELIIPDGLKFLSFTGDYKSLKGLKIKQANKGKYLELHFHGLKEFLLPDFNLNQLKKLSMRMTALDMESVANYYPNISELYIWGNPGFIHHFNALKQLTYLSDIQFNDVFGYTGTDFPSPKDLPLLDRIWLTSVPEEVGKYVKKHFKHISDLSVSKLRNKTWLEANLDNPFRTWDGREGTSASKAKKAFDAYKNACTQIDKMKNTGQTKGQEKKIIADFVEVFNKMDAKGGIDTLESEEIFDVFNLLQLKMNLARDTYAEYFDELRDF